MVERGLKVNVREDQGVMAGKELSVFFRDSGMELELHHKMQYSDTLLFDRRDF